MNGLCVDKPRQSYTAGKFPLPQWRSRPPEAGVRRTQSPPRASTPHKRFKVSINSDGSGKTWPSGATYNVVDKVLISVEHPHLSQSQFAAEPDESGDHMLQNKKEAVKSIINQDNGVAWEKITIIFAHLATAATFFAAGHSVLEDAFLPPSPNKLAGKFGAFFILYSVFVEDREMAVALTYLVGMTGTCTEFFRMYTFQQSFSGFLACITLTSASLYVINSVILDRRILRTRLWRSWRGFGAILGYILVPQLSVALLKETSQMLEPRSVALHAGLLGAFFGVVAQLMLKKKGIRQDLGAWSATVIFMLLSVDDMMETFKIISNGNAALAASPTQLIPLILSTGLQIPRAIRCHNSMWLLGTSWATAFSVLQLIMIYAPRTVLSQLWVVVGIFIVFLVVVLRRLFK